MQVLMCSFIHAFIQTHKYLVAVIEQYREHVAPDFARHQRVRRHDRIVVVTSRDGGRGGVHAGVVGEALVDGGGWPAGLQ